MKKNVLIIGAGGVGHVVAHKCAQHNRKLGAIHLASRNPAKCQQIIDSIHARGSLQEPGILEAHALDALDIDATRALIRQLDIHIVINVGSAFVNMAVLRACLDTGAAYLDTAIHEDPAKICGCCEQIEEISEILPLSTIKYKIKCTPVKLDGTVALPLQRFVRCAFFIKEFLC